MSEQKAELWQWTDASGGDMKKAVPTGWLVETKQDDGSSATTWVPDPGAPHVIELSDARKEVLERAAVELNFRRGIVSSETVRVRNRSGYWKLRNEQYVAVIWFEGFSTELVKAKDRDEALAVVRDWVLDGRSPDGVEMPR